MNRSSFLFAALASISIGCGAADPPSPVAASTAAPNPTSSSPPVVASAAPTDAPVAPAAPRVAVDVPATMARLPKDAAVYGWMRPAAIDTLFDWSSMGGEIRRELNRKTGETRVRAVLTQLGIEPGAPIAAAVLSPDLREAQKLLDAVVSSKDATAIFAKSAPNGTFIRFVARKIAGVDVAARFHTLAAQARLDVVACPADPLCAELGTARPSFVALDRKIALGLYVEGDRVELDVVNGEEAPARKLRLLGARRTTPTGAPTGRCETLDPEADLSVCVDPERSGELGAATGMRLVTSVLDTVDSKMRGKIAKQGKIEAMRNIELSKPATVLLDDGTFSVTFGADGYRANATWRTTEASKKNVEARFAQEQCGELPSGQTTLLGALVQAFPDPGKDFKKADRVEHVREAGFGGFLVLFGRTWPNLLQTAMASGAPADGEMAPFKVCLKSAGGRLHAESKGAPIRF